MFYDLEDPMTFAMDVKHILDDDVKIEILCSPKIDNILFQSIKTKDNKSELNMDSAKLITTIY